MPLTRKNFSLEVEKCRITARIDFLAAENVNDDGAHLVKVSNDEGQMADALNHDPTLKPD